ncbi:MAG: hypothetical protein U0232_27445 [Thermomicrobiales bacterium]
MASDDQRTGRAGEPPLAARIGAWRKKRRLSGDFDPILPLVVLLRQLLQVRDMLFQPAHPPILGVNKIGIAPPHRRSRICLDNARSRRNVPNVT